MDILTHILSGVLTWKVIDGHTKTGLFVTILFSVLPDIGEIPIQFALRKKFGARVFVYDDRTSDLIVAESLSVTWVYDVLHSLIIPVLILLYIWIMRNDSMILFLGGISWVFHVFLDSFTHGRVWALKLFFPVLGFRFPILQDTVGNWWEWKPTFKIGKIYVSFLLIGVWISLATIMFFL